MNRTQLARLLDAGANRLGTSGSPAILAALPPAEPSE